MVGWGSLVAFSCACSPQSPSILLAAASAGALAGCAAHVALARLARVRARAAFDNARAGVKRARPASARALPAHDEQTRGMLCAPHCAVENMHADYAHAIRSFVRAGARHANAPDLPPRAALAALRDVEVSAGAHGEPGARPRNSHALLFDRAAASTYLSSDWTLLCCVVVLRDLARRVPPST